MTTIFHRMTYLPSLLQICILAFSAIACESFLIIGEVRTCRRQKLLKTTALRAMTNATEKVGTSGATAPYLQNFRQASGLSQIYRCASTDTLADILEEHGSFETAPLQHSERILLQETGLILDLRSESERDEERAKRWTSRAPGSPFSLQDVVPETHVPSSKTNRQVLRIDVLSPSRFMNYASDNWLTPSQKALSTLYWIFNADKVHEMRIDALNERGLAGLYEVILETGGAELCVALQEITLHLEQQQSSVVIHCVQGKDRTGMLVMLCQSILGLSDEEIVADYHKSDVMRESSASEVMKPRRKGKLDRDLFSGSPQEAMVQALNCVRKKHGSVSPGYVDFIGFDQSWRERLRQSIEETSLFSSKL